MCQCASAAADCQCANDLLASQREEMFTAVSRFERIENHKVKLCATP
jgi:hypothetical protein